MQDSIITANARKMLLITAGAFCLSAVAGFSTSSSEAKRAGERSESSRSVESASRISADTLAATLRRG